jgi:hypothetical protein
MGQGQGAGAGAGGMGMGMCLTTCACSWEWSAAKELLSERVGASDEPGQAQTAGLWIVLNGTVHELLKI